MKFTPHPYQEYCIKRVIEEPFIELMLDMGLGKTVIVLKSILELKFYRFQISKVLIIAPKKVAEATWCNEAAKWDELSPLRFSLVLGSEKKRLAALDAKADIYITNRENTQWIVDHYKHSWPFDMVVLDEASSFKSPTAKRFKAMKAMRPRIKRLVELTGTPTPKGLIDLWAQIYLLDGGKRLGRTLSTYRDVFFVPDKRNAQMVFSYKPRAGAEEAIYEAISDIAVSMKAEDYLTLPDCIYETIPVKLDEKAQRGYTELERETLLQIDEATITAGSAGVLTGKLLQLCAGAVYDTEGKVQHLHDCKLEAFLELVEQLNGQHALVFYNFQHDKDRLVAALAKTGLHVRVYTCAQDADDWNDGKIDLLLAHPASCAYGLNLQRGGHHIIWFTPTWSLEQYQQANKRLHRQGQQMPVIVHLLAVQGGVDETVIESLSAKENVQNRLLAALKAKVAKVKEEST